MATVETTTKSPEKGDTLSIFKDKQAEALKYLKENSIIVYFLTFLFLYTSIKVEMDVWTYYLLFGITLFMIGFWVESGSNVEVFPRKQLRISEVPTQILGGFLFAIAFIVVATLIGTLALKTNVGAGQFIADLIPMIIIIGGVETLMLIVYVKVLYMGAFVYPIIFAFSHSQIAYYWTQGLFPLESLNFFFYALAQGIIFLLIYFGRTLVPEPFNKLFGAVTVAVYHGAINIMVLYSVYLPGGA